jgi:Secretion system C-terminal sorting domain
MKTKFPYVLSFLCIFFTLVGINIYAQCPNGISVTVTTSLSTSNTAIPFCTPITITTTVTNSSSTGQTVNLQTSFNRANYDLLCLDDYAQDCSSSPTSATQSLCRNSLFIPSNGGQIVSKMRLLLRSTGASIFPPPSALQVISQLNANANCFDFVQGNALLLNLEATPLGTPGQNTTFNSLPHPSSIVDNGALIIRGNVTLNFDHTISNQLASPNNFSFIAMDDGATLTVANGRTLNLRSTNVFGCRTMWNSIIVESGATFYTDADPANSNKLTTIEDGIRAIEARNGATIGVSRTNFTDNLTSVYVAPANLQQSINFSPFLACKFEGTGTLKPAPNSTNCNFNRVYGYPYTGFDINNLSRLEILFSPYFVRTRFKNLSNGILANQTGLFINQLKFENIKDSYSGQGGIGVRVNGPNAWFLAAGQNDVNNLDFNNCSIGFQYDNMSGFRLAQMNSITMDNRADNNGIGVFAINNSNIDAYIYVMDIRARLGIASFMNHPNIGEIYLNNIEATYPSNPQHLDPNPLNVNQSRFNVGSPNAPIMPTFSPSNWFQVTGGTDFTCANSNTCPNGSPAGRMAAPNSNNDAYYRLAISEERMPVTYADETKWTEQRNAYGRLMDNPSEQNSRDITTFVARMSTSSIGQLYQVEKSIKNMHTIGDEFRDILIPNMASIKTLATEIADLEMKIIETKDRTQLAALTDQKNWKSAAIHRLTLESAPYQATIQRKKQEECVRLVRDNDNISARLQPEINEKEVNKIYLQTVVQGKMKLSEEQKAIVKTIAYQCPSQGGNAVFAARSLYALVEKISFDDLALCNARNAQVEPIAGLKIKKNDQFRISPNPATDVLSVRQPSEKVEAGEWVIFDMAGKLLLNKKVGEQEIDSNINIQGLSEGVYFVSFIVNGHKQFTQKFIKIKTN